MWLVMRELLEGGKILCSIQCGSLEHCFGSPVAFNQKGISKTSLSENSLLNRKRFLERFEAVCFGLVVGFCWFGLAFFVSAFFSLFWIFFF